MLGIRGDFLAAQRLLIPRRDEGEGQRRNPDTRQLNARARAELDVQI